MLFSQSIPYNITTMRNTVMKTDARITSGHCSRSGNKKTQTQTTTANQCLSPRLLSSICVSLTFLSVTERTLIIQQLDEREKKKLQKLMITVKHSAVLTRKRNTPERRVIFYCAKQYSVLEYFWVYMAISDGVIDPVSQNNRISWSRSQHWSHINTLVLLHCDVCINVKKVFLDVL